MVNRRDVLKTGVGLASLAILPQDRGMGYASVPEALNPPEYIFPTYNTHLNKLLHGGYRPGIVVIDCFYHSLYPMNSQDKTLHLYSNKMTYTIEELKAQVQEMYLYSMKNNIVALVIYIEFKSYVDKSMPVDDRYRPPSSDEDCWHPTYPVPYWLYRSANVVIKNNYLLKNRYGNTGVSICEK